MLKKCWGILVGTTTFHFLQLMQQEFGLWDDRKFQFRQLLLVFGVVYWGWKGNDCSGHHALKACRWGWIWFCFMYHHCDPAFMFTFLSNLKELSFLLSSNHTILYLQPVLQRHVLLTIYINGMIYEIEARLTIIYLPRYNLVRAY